MSGTSSTSSNKNIYERPSTATAVDVHAVPIENVTPVYASPYYDSGLGQDNQGQEQQQYINNQGQQYSNNNQGQQQNNNNNYNNNNNNEGQLQYNNNQGPHYNNPQNNQSNHPNTRYSNFNSDVGSVSYRQQQQIQQQQYLPQHPVVYAQRQQQEDIALCRRCGRRFTRSPTAHDATAQYYR